eukprot:954227-Prymnesium_polylepis.2
MHLPWRPCRSRHDSYRARASPRPGTTGSPSATSRRRSRCWSWATPRGRSSSTTTADGARRPPCPRPHRAIARASFCAKYDLARVSGIACRRHRGCLSLGPCALRALCALCTLRALRTLLPWARVRRRYAWLLESLVALVYGGGFIVMTPQLFINYRLKSVAHLPWKCTRRRQALS